MVSSRSQSANTIAGFLPPSSNETGLQPPAHPLLMAAPVGDSPVNVTALISGWLTRYSPVEPSPNPCTRLKTPFGTPASRITSANKVALAGVSSHGLAHTASPQ